MNEILDTKLMHPRDQITMIITRIYKRGMTTTSGGNISVIDGKGDIWVTPSAIDKGTLRPSDIICIKQDGTILGRHKPSSEYPFHMLAFGAHFMGRKEIPELISSGIPSIIIQNDSILITGDKLLQTFDRLEVAEFSAKSLVMAKPIGDLLPINDKQIAELKRVFLNK